MRWDALATLGAASRSWAKMNFAATRSMRLGFLESL
jgi:hypothetical protein